MIETLVERAVARRRAVLIATAIFAVIGALSIRGMRFDALPDVTGQQVIVLTTAPGLTPEEVERLVTRPLEISLGGMPGLVETRSVSRYGLSAITSIFEDSTDIYRARQLVGERVAIAQEQLPPSASPPELGPVSGGLGEIYQFTLSSSERTPAELLELVQRRVAPILRTAPGVVEVNTWGGGRRTLDVIGDPVRMARWGVTLSALREAASRSTGSVTGATVPAGPAHVLLRGVALPTTPAEIAAAVVRVDPQDPTRVVRIGDVADVISGQEPRIGAATEGGRGETVYVMVQMLLAENALEVLRGVHERLPDVRAALPDDVVVNEVYDRSDLVSATLSTVGKSLLEGGLLVIAVLFAMLGSLRAGLLVALVIPLSMLGAVMGMAFFGVPGNLMSLGALDFGLLVDGAVVVVESVFHHFAAFSPRNREHSHERFEGHARDDRPADAQVAETSRSVARPVFYSVLVILLVYLPILALEGIEGKMYRPMAITVVMALATSLVLALTFVPAAAARWLRPEHVPAREPLLVRASARAYAPILDVAMRRPVLVVAIAIGLALIGARVFWTAGSAFVPQLDEGDLVVQTTRAPDVSIETAIAEGTRLEQVIREAAPEVRHVSSRIGSPAVATDVMGIEQADVFVSLYPRDDWAPGRTLDDVIADLRGAIDARAPGAELSFTQPIQMRFNELVGGAVTDVALVYYGEDLDVLSDLAERSAAVLREVPGAVDVRVTAPPSVSLVEVRPRPLESSAAGFDAQDVLEAVGALRAGVHAADTWEGPLRIPIRVRLGASTSAFTIADVGLPTASGALIPLSRVAHVDAQEAPALVSHENGARRIVIGFNVRGRDLGTVVQEAEARIDAAVDVPRGYRAEWGGQYEGLERARERLAIVIPIVLIAILVLLYRVFGRVRPVLVIFMNVPFAAVGGMIALAMRGLPISVSAAVGFIALSGIAVLNGVVLMSRIMHEEAEGFAPDEAARRAARARLRPVLTTALVASLGFVPMMLARGVGAEVQRPLATVVVGGLVTSTWLTLVLIPSIHPWIARIRRRPDEAALGGGRGEARDAPGAGPA
ncbi:efflux RND transporter permease subunit [Sandaracinus amylolyticus]|uniref:Cobalt-zinc-cadmium resistance protein CzcA n=1 Tax=Sandaracinus amylolyticus TaxID=927083 RepID=A0A0F6SGD4_9BACT|nr:CusA/CzcA family heavy metal efflux RND transporter [Sandaracinus amylolyticus]AKF08499.1 Cobalt-zinc-cadmium resistance protein CzcA [Sandaracinus amylolyticus]